MLTRRLMCMGSLLAFLAACSPPPPPPTSVQLSIVGDANMNGGAPARVKVYYLTETATFRASDFFAVFDAPEATLGSDLVAVSEFQLAPGRSVSDLRELPADASAIGAVAAFRDVNDRFLAIKPLVAGTANPVQILLNGNTVSIR